MRFMAKQKFSQIGISINTDWIELVQISKDGRTIKSRKTPMPMATMDPNGDRLRDPQTLATSIAAMVAELNAKPPIKILHVTVPGTLVRIVEMPKMPKNELVLALTSEAERYAIFNDTEAMVDYEVIGEEPDEKQKIILVALRKDTVAGYKEAFDIARLKMASLEVETISTLRGLKHSGTMDNLLAEVGDQPWGMIHFEPERVRIAVWHYDQIKNWREVLLDTSDLKVMGEEAPVVQDLVEEVRRTIGMTRPALWLTYGIAENLSTSLTPRLGATVRPMLSGDNLNLDDPKLSLAAIGIAAKSYQPFPAYINIQPSADMQTVSEISGSFKIMITIALILLVLFGIAVGVLFGINFYFETQIADTKKKIETKTAEQTTLQAEVDKMQKDASIKNEFATRANKIVTQNNTYSKIASYIKEKIPSNIQLESIVIEGENIIIKGKSLDYPSIDQFAKNFDEAKEPNSPINNLALNNVNQTTDTDKKEYYNFQFTGQVKMK